jgi:hypothetical protein
MNLRSSANSCALRPSASRRSTDRLSVFENRIKGWRRHRMVRSSSAPTVRPCVTNGHCGRSRDGWSRREADGGRPRPLDAFQLPSPVDSENTTVPGNAFAGVLTMVDKFKAGAGHKVLHRIGGQNLVWTCKRRDASADMACYLPAVIV